MTVFVLVALGLLALALLIILPALLRGAPRKEIERREQNIAIARERLEGLKLALEEGSLDQEQFEQERKDLEAGLLDDIDAVDANMKVGGAHRWSAVLVIIALPLISAGLYSYLGNPSFLNSEAVKATAPSGEQLTIDEMVTKLEQRLEQDPENVEGWFMLNRTYMALQRYDQAVIVMRKVRQLMGDQTGVLSDLADAVAMKQGGVLSGEPVELLAIVLEREPQNVKALWLMGMYEYQQKNGTKALEYWYQLEPLLGSEPDAQQEVRRLISMAEQMAGVKPKATLETSSVAVAPGQVVVNVDIKPELTRELTGNETLFILARAKNGSPMPLAVARHVVSDLPLRVALDDSMAMTPASKLSGHKEVEVLARVSRSGQAMPQPGDLFGMANNPVVPGGDSVTEVLIDQIKQ